MKSFLRPAVYLCFGLMVCFSAAAQRYKKSDIADARFGTGDHAKLLEKAQNIADRINQVIIGQEVAAESLQQRLVQYLESFPHRTKEPVSLHLIGLPGVGKTAIVSVLRKNGFKVVHFDAQKYSGISGDFTHDVANALREDADKKRPVILVVEELDKVKELATNIVGKEDTTPLIGTLNQILSDGIISQYGVPIDVSNVFVLTTMNFAPQHITEFTAEVLKNSKSFYDLTLEDLRKFIDWVKESPGARYKILSKLFRTNTVGRIAPNTVIMEPIVEDAYRAIAEMTVMETIRRNTSEANSKKRVQVGFDKSFIEFLVEEAVYPPSGARETVFRADALTEQLINYGIKSQRDPSDSSDVPRQVFIAYDKESQSAQITVTPLLLKGKKLVAGAPFQVISPYNFSSRMFSEPQLIRKSKPRYPSTEKKIRKRITKKMVRETRFPKAKDLAKGLDQAISSRLVGQGRMAEVIKDDLNRYLSRQGPAKKEPSFRALSGFPGIGKSEMVKIVAEYLKLPLIKLNMQQFSSDSADTVSSFFETVNDLLRQHNLNYEKKPFIFLIEELDKVYEINPKGEVTNRPIMGAIKDLLNDGQATLVHPTNGSRRVIDIRHAFTFITMNFSVDRFKFDADPRLTSVEDVLNAWKKISSTPMATKSVLGSMFLPETVSRLMSRFSIVKPPNRNEYIQLVRSQIETVVSQRLIDEEGKNVAQVDIEPSKRYLEYLFNETVIPSEGARNTVVSASGLIGSDLEDTFAKLPRSSKYATEPLVVSLDYLPSKRAVIAKVRLASEEPKVSIKILEKPVALNFPPLSVTGKIEEKRVLVAAHEFGHAFLGARLGLRFETVVVTSPTPGIGGYVKLAGSRFSALEKMGNIYGLLGARAMERMILNDDPMAIDSVMNITAGASNDIQQASKTLFDMIYELGFDPWGGIIDRNFIMGLGKYADVAALPSEVAAKLGQILRELEDRIVEDLMSTQGRDWYVQKIMALAKKGVMSEKEFYKLVGYEHPGDSEMNFGTTTHLRKLFKRYLSPTGIAKSSFRQKRGQEALTVEENTEKYLGWFTEALKKHLHGEACEDLLK